MDDSIIFAPFPENSLLLDPKLRITGMFKEEHGSMIETRDLFKTDNLQGEFKGGNQR